MNLTGIRSICATCGQHIAYQGPGTDGWWAHDWGQEPRDPEHQPEPIRLPDGSFENPNMPEFYMVFVPVDTLDEATGK